ncbi:MAG: histidinol phosphate phosphatase domain-containing protein [Chloroflexi bacterium]|nr:histidinol phosphate phosphatase domain-containing protein [Chloroflexota bacterium]
MSAEVYDFHTHTYLSDGELSPIELIRRAIVRGYRVIGLADHAGPGTMEVVVPQLVDACAYCSQHWDILAIPGVELTHLPPGEIDRCAREARRLGARLIVVHGETPVEPVPPGTNAAAVASDAVDVVAHPGLLLLEEAGEACRRGIFLEISPRRGHSLANGHVARLSEATGARGIVNSDGHSPADLLTAELARHVARCSGLGEEMVRRVVKDHPRALLARIDGRSGRRA